MTLDGLNKREFKMNCNNKVRWIKMSLNYNKKINGMMLSSCKNKLYGVLK